MLVSFGFVFPNNILPRDSTFGPENMPHCHLRHWTRDPPLHSVGHMLGQSYLTSVITIIMGLKLLLMREV